MLPSSAMEAVLSICTTPSDTRLTTETTKLAVPLAPAYVKGLINLRGQIVTVLDLRQRLGFAPLAEESTGMNLIVQSAEGPMSLLVDTIGNVLDIPVEQLVPLLPELRATVRS